MAHSGSVPIIDFGTFSTTDAEMFGRNGPASIDEDFYAVNTGRLAAKSVGKIENKTNPARALWQTSFDGCKATFGYLGVTDSQCKNGHTFKTFLGDIKVPGVGSAPAATVKDGTRVTFKDAELDLGINVKVELAPGTVNASQDFSIEMQLSTESAKEGELVTLSTSKALGDNTLASDFSVIDMGVSALTKLAYEVQFEQYILGLKTVNATPINVDTGLEKREILGLEVGEGALDLRTFGESNVLELTDGVGLEIGAPGIFPPPLDKFVKAPIADVTAFIPKLDVEETAGPGNGAKVEVEKRPGNRTSDDPVLGDFAKVDLDMDVATVYASRIPMGLEFGVPIVANVQLDVLDADLGGFFSLAQNQSFEAGHINIRLDFSKPVEVEVSPGVFETRTEFVVKAGDDLNFRHPGGVLDFESTYELASNSYSNLTEFLFSPTFTYKFLNAGVNIIGVVDEEITMLEDVLELSDPIRLGQPVFDSMFALDGFNTVSGASFSLAAGPAIATVPLPATGLLGLGAFAALGLFGRKGQCRRI
jgi:hypothetical protein